jgi:signal transduction histidine kinase
MVLYLLRGGFILASIFFFQTFIQAQDLGKDQKLLALLDSAESASRKFDSKRINMLILEAEQLLPSTDTDSIRHLYYWFTSSHYFRANRIDKAIENATMSLAIATGMEDRRRKLLSHSSLANAYSYQGNHTNSLYHQNKALYYLSVDDSASYYAILNNKSHAFTAMGMVDSALYLLTQSKRYYAREGKTAFQALLEMNIGELYRNQIGDLALARRHMRRSIALYTGLGDMDGLGKVQHNYGLAQQAEGNLDSARFFFEESLRIQTELGNEGAKAISLHSLGALYLMEGESAKGIAALGEAKRICEENEITIGLYHVSMSLANGHQALGNYKIALDNVEAALKISRAQKRMNEERQATKLLYELNKGFNRWEEALGAFEQYALLNDTIHERQLASSLAEVRTRYETEITEGENETLRAQKDLNDKQIRLQRFMLYGLSTAMVPLMLLSYFLYRAIRQRDAALSENEANREALQDQLTLVHNQRAKLLEANEFKNRVISVIGHDLRAPLSSVVSMLELTKASIRDAGISSEIYERLQREARSNLNSLQNLLEWSRTEVQSTDPVRSTFNQAEVVAEVIALNQSSLEEKSLRVSANSSGIFTADVNQVRSILTNLLGNAIKYTPQGGHISVEAVADDNNCKIVISDNGAGISDEIIALVEGAQLVSSSRGTAGERGTGLGLRLVRDFAKAHGGTLKFSRNPEGGTVAEVRYPKNPMETVA